MTTFREGDVVRVARWAQWPDGIVQPIRSGDRGVRVMFEGASDTMIFKTDVLTLLRRPVRVGDVLRVKRSLIEAAPSEWAPPSWSNKVIHATAERLEFEGEPAPESEDEEPAKYENYEHSDGTPIEPPKAEAPKVVETPFFEVPAGAKISLSISKVGSSPVGGETATLTVTKTEKVLPTVEQLARALFETDPRVQVFVRERSDAALFIHDEPGATLPANVRGGETAVDVSKAVRVARIAWDRDEGGWRTEIWHRAETVLAVMSSLTPGPGQEP